jgi:Flp pilus assembly pilin Flp
MTEYALILAAVAIAVVVTYQVMGQKINNLTTWQVDNDLSVAS